MRATSRLLWVAALLALPLAATAELPAGLDAGEVYGSWGAALRATGLDLAQPIKGTPIAYADGVAVYRVEGLLDGEVAYNRVALPFDPTVPVEEESAPALQLDLGGGATDLGVSVPVQEPGLENVNEQVTYSHADSCRCLIYAYKNEYYGTLLLITNLDWNDFSSYSGLNDSFDSLKTTCNGAFFFTNKNWGGSYLYMNTYVNIPVLSIYGFHDNISSMYHDLP